MDRSDIDPIVIALLFQKSQMLFGDFEVKRAVVDKSIPYSPQKELFSYSHPSLPWA
jgi:hypothetical protein